MVFGLADEFSVRSFENLARSWREVSGFVVLGSALGVLEAGVC